MQLYKLTIKGFRCFGLDGTTIEFGPLTTFVGANGAGKSAALMALVRMFGVTTAHRTLTREDFHVSPSAGKTTQLELRIEAWFQFPELMSDADAASSDAVPECLKHIIVSESGPIPFCRIRLDGRWSAGPAAEGDVEQQLFWVNSDAVDVSDDKIHPLSSVERRLIQILYVPATRDAVRELRAVSGTILSRVLKHISWSDELKERVVKLDRELTTAVRAEATLSDLEATLRQRWSALSGSLSVPSFSFADADLAGVLRRLDTGIEGPGGTRSIDLLSEGERSLLYFALVESTLTFEAKIAATGVLPLDGGPRPVLTLLAVEEPENHLAPQYLGRIVKALRDLIKAGRVQAFLTSHSASIMHRIEPDEVRHFRANTDGTHRITRLSLPKNSDEAIRYVREAVKSHPELYFASVVVLGEGASEEIVLPRIAKAMDLDIDPRFVAVVPLGGRHVHHFWRLLREIGTPYVTLVDLDLERSGGGWLRLRELLDELVSFGEQSADVLGGVHIGLVDQIPVPITDTTLASWIKHLEVGFDIFLNAPLDLDFAMLEAFLDNYKKLVPSRGGPEFPEPGEDDKPFIERVTRATLGPKGGNGRTYSLTERALFPWYAYFFESNRSKPATHARCLAECDDALLAKSAPDVLRRLVDRVKTLAPK